MSFYLDSILKVKKFFAIIFFVGKPVRREQLAARDNT